MTLKKNDLQNFIIFEALLSGVLHRLMCGRAINVNLSPKINFEAIKLLCYLISVLVLAHVMMHSCTNYFCLMC